MIEVCTLLASRQTLETIIEDNTDHFAVLPYEDFLKFKEVLAKFPGCRQALIDEIGIDAFTWYKIKT